MRGIASFFMAGLVVGACSSRETTCFVAGTQIATPDGPRSIESLAVGDAVWSFNHEESRIVKRIVATVFRSEVREVRTIKTRTATLRGATPSHPIYLPGLGAYRPLAEVTTGTSVLRFGSDQMVDERIEEISADERPTPSIAVYNLHVEGPEHNFFADGILVHNKSPITVGQGGSGGQGQGGAGGTLAMGGSGAGGAACLAAGKSCSGPDDCKARCCSKDFSTLDAAVTGPVATYNCK